MKRVNKEDLRVVHSALTHFVGSMIRSLNDDLSFETCYGEQGYVQKKMTNDSYDIFVEDELVYNVEGEFFDICNYDQETDCDLIMLYNKMLEIDPYDLKYRTRTFYYSVRRSMENIILNMNLPLNGETKIDNYQLFYTPEHKFKINLN